jgi:hypothetical protein
MKLKSLVILSVVFGVGLGMVASDFAAAQPFRPPLPGRGGFVAPRGRLVLPRAPVVTHRNWPLKRAPRAVIVRPPRVVNRVRVVPRMYLPPIVFGGAVVGLRYDRRYGRDRIY